MKPSVKSLFFIITSLVLLKSFTSANPIPSESELTLLEDPGLNDIEEDETRILRDADKLFRKGFMVYQNVQMLVGISQRRLRFENLGPKMRDAVLDYLEAFSEEAQSLMETAEQNKNVTRMTPQQRYQSAFKWHRDIRNRAKILSKYISRHYKGFTGYRE